MSALGKALGAALVVLLTLLACSMQAPPPSGTPFGWMWAASPTPVSSPTIAVPTLTPTFLPSPTATPVYPHAGQVAGQWNCRTEPFGVVIVWFNGGEPVTVLTDDSKGWAQVRYKDQECWIVLAALK